MLKLIPLLLILAACIEQPAPQATSSAIKQRPECNLDASIEALSDPRSIEELVDLLNALPKPLELDCFLKSLRRPLYVNANASTLSAQPATGSDNPRIFIFKNNLIITVVPSGAGARLLEMSELKSKTRSIKGELRMPITGRVEQSDPYRMVITEGKTSCSGCHSLEYPEHRLEGIQVYSSVAIRPTPKRDVPLDELEFYNHYCKVLRDNSERCLALDALLSHGEVIAQPFPSEMPDFFQSIQMGINGG
jgi:hypothetical protein